MGKQIKLKERAWKDLMKSDLNGNDEMDLDEFAQMLRDIFAGEHD